MGNQLKPLREAQNSKVVTMKFFALITLVPLALCDAEAEPSYDQGRYAAHKYRRHYTPVCQTVYDTITEQVCTNVTESVCSNITVTEIRTETREECSTRTEPECVTVIRDVPEELCTNTTEVQC